MVRTFASGRYHKSASGRRVRLIPATPRQEPPTPSSSSSSTTDSTQSPVISPSDSQSGSPEGVMRRTGFEVEMPYPFTYQPTSTKNEEIPPSMPNSPEDLNDIAHLSDTQAVNFTSSSTHDLIADKDSEEGGTGRARAKGEMINRERSVRMEQMAVGSKQTEDMVDIVVVDSEEDEGEMKDNFRQTSRQGMERTHFSLEGIASETIREMQEFDRKWKGKSVEIPKEPASGTQGESETEDEEVTVPARWKRKIEETVDGLVAENATHRTLMKEQKEQLIMVVDLVGIMFSLMDGKSESAPQQMAPVPYPRENDSDITPTSPTTTKAPSSSIKSASQEKN